MLRLGSLQYCINIRLILFLFFRNFQKWQQNPNLARFFFLNAVVFLIEYCGIVWLSDMTDLQKKIDSMLLFEEVGAQFII